MKVIGRLKKAVSGSTSDRIKREFNQKGIDLVLIPDYLEVENIDNKGYEVFTYEKYLKWFLEKNYVTEESINIVRNKWRILSKGFNFVIAVGKGNNKSFYDPIRFNNMQSKIGIETADTKKADINDLKTSVSSIDVNQNEIKGFVSTINTKADTININEDVIKINGKSIDNFLDDKLNEVLKSKNAEIKNTIDKCVICGSKLPTHTFSKICSLCHERVNRTIYGNTI